MPTWASLIMETSLAPSPIARVSACGSSCLIMRTTSAFCFGETRQQITASHVLLTRMKLVYKSARSVILINAGASTIRALRYLFFISISFYLIKSSEQNYSTCSRFFIRYTSKSGLISLQERAMFSAVLNWSPVSIHTLIPASWKSLMTSGTFS